ncbi:MAG: DUF4417 domain-containing protein [Christensenellales bacterium]
MFKYKDIFNLELLNNVRTIKPFDLPILEQINEIPKDVISFNYCKTCKTPEKYFVHFYIDDYQFERVWNRPKYYATILGRFKGIIAPDYSTYSNMPVAQQIFQVYKSRLISAYFQALGYKVIPNISWSDEKSLEWSLAGIPKHSTIALSTNGCLNKETKDNFIKCYKKAIAELEPTTIIIIGDVPAEIQNKNIVQFSNRINHLRKITKKE